MVLRLVMSAAVAAALAGCTLYDPQGRPPPGAGFDAATGFGGSQRGYSVQRLRDQPATGRAFATNADGLTRQQTTALLDGCAVLFEVDSDDLRACEAGDLAFDEALETGCRAAYEGSDLAQCLAPLGG